MDGINWSEALGAAAKSVVTEARRQEGEAGEDTASGSGASQTQQGAESQERQGAGGQTQQGAEGQEQQGSAEPGQPAASEEGGAEGQPKGPEAAGAPADDENALRQRELQELERRIRAEERARAEEGLNSFISGMGLVDAEGKPVLNREQYEAHMSRQNRELIDEELGRLGVDRSVFDAIINSHPAVTEARRAAEAARQAERRGLDAAAEARAAEQLAEIGKLDPSVKTMADLQAHPSYGQVYAYVKGGLSIAEAFTAANLDAIRERDRRAAAQAAMNAANSKAHMTAHDSGGGELTEPVPEGVRRSYRELYGNISEEEIKSKYERVQKSKQKG